MSQRTPPNYPKCGTNTRIVCRGKKYAIYPSGCLVIVGLPIAMLHQASAPFEFECETCSTRFAARSLVAKLCLAMIVLLVLWLLAAIALAFHRA